VYTCSTVDIGTLTTHILTTPWCNNVSQLAAASTKKSAIKVLSYMALAAVTAELLIGALHCLLYF
jgi:hypothetical protein